MALSDLAVDAFLLLRDSFFDDSMRPIPFGLRPKRNTQDDPLDEHISKLLQQGLGDATCHKAPGPLISPDLVLYRPGLCRHRPRAKLATDTTRIIAIEIKKLERTRSGKIARSTGLDFNTTPPCGVVRIYAVDDLPLDVRGFYLFLAQETTPDNRYVVTALVLCDGNVLNEDFALYLAAIGQREKDIGLGTYGNGVDRRRPMFIFANPLGSRELDHQATLILVGEADNRIRLAYHIARTTTAGEERWFHAYRKTSDVSDAWEVRALREPFPQPTARVSQTQSRGKFRLPIEIL